jgi:hypothetical protein
MPENLDTFTVELQALCKVTCEYPVLGDVPSVVEQAVEALRK